MDTRLHFLQREAERLVARRTAIALGSNLGDRDGHLRYGAACLGDLLTDLLVSEFIDTSPFGVSGPDQPRFLNAAAVGWSADTPAGLLSQLHRIEQARGRDRPFAGAPRTLDLDLVLVGELVVSTPVLKVPHPGFRQRAFVLGPLASIAPDLVDPVTTLTVRQLFSQLCTPGH